MCNVIHKYLLDEQFEQSCVYTKNKDGLKVTFILWEDDTIVATNDSQYQSLVDDTFF